MRTYWGTQGTLLSAPWWPKWGGNPQEWGYMCMCGRSTLLYGRNWHHSGRQLCASKSTIKYKWKWKNKSFQLTAGRQPLWPLLLFFGTVVSQAPGSFSGVSGGHGSTEESVLPLPVPSPLPSHCWYSSICHSWTLLCCFSLQNKTKRDGVWGKKIL